MFVCKVHIDTEVNFKGRGCNICESDKLAREQKRLEKKLARRERNG